MAFRCTTSSSSAHDLDSWAWAGTELFALLRGDQQGSKPSIQTYRSLLQVCMKRKSLAQAKLVHAQLVAHGLETNRGVCDVVVATLVKCGGLEDGIQLFNRLPNPSILSWTAIISGYIDRGLCQDALSFFEQMKREGVQPNRYTFVSLLKACSKLEDLEQGRQIHALALKLGFGSDLFVSSTLVNMYAKCGSVKDAQQVFDAMCQRDVVSWNAILTAHAQQEQGAEALEIYRRMQLEGITPTARTFVSALQACGSLADTEDCTFVDGQFLKVSSLQKGREIHASARVRGFETDIFVGNTLVSVYAKCGSIKDAEHVFEKLSQRDVVTWTAMIAANAQQDQGDIALELFVRMQNDGVRPNARTFVSALQACSSLAGKEESMMVDGQYVKVRALQTGRKIHAGASSCGFERDIFVANSLVSMYAKCGSIKDAEQVFERLSHRDVVSWTAMIAGYAHQEQGDKALQAYGQMQAEGVKSNESTFVSVLEACSCVGALDVCAQVHHGIVNNGLESKSSMATSLIHAYGKCGSMVDAQRVFDSLHQPDVVPWTALICGYARLGDSKMSMASFEHMKTAGVRPNALTFTALLSACSHAGMVDRGLAYFQSMTRDHGIFAEVDHYACVIDLVGRAGLLSSAAQMVSQMPMPPDLAVWLCLLSACRKHCNVVLAKRAFDAVMDLDPRHAAAYVLMSSIYADAGMRESAFWVDQSGQSVIATKKPGQSWIEHKQQIHTFAVGDHKRQYNIMIVNLLRFLRTELKKAGYSHMCKRL